MNSQVFSWLKIAFRLQGSVVPSILPLVIFVGGFGGFISLIYSMGFPVAFPFLSAIVPSIVLGLLLVFRTNTAYERYWEGRKCWGTLIVTIRNLSRQIWIIIKTPEVQDIDEKKQVIHLLLAFAVATKLHLREEDITPDLTSLISPSQHEILQSINNRPLQIAFWIADYLNNQSARNCLNIYQVTAMHQLINSIVDVLGGCERILKTPMPLAYSIHLKQLLLLYCLALPFQMVKDLGWLTGFIVALISFTLLGIEQIGLEIENPFGHDPNDLPLDTICNTMRRNIEDLISVSPNVHI
jgi:putative membrane protein